MQINEGTISEIQISGNQKTKDFIIRNAITLKAGTVYNERVLTACLRKLYANGYFQDIRRTLQPSKAEPDKYVLKVEVDEKRTALASMNGGMDTVAGPFGSFNIGDSNFLGSGQQIAFRSQVGGGMMGSIANNVNNGGTPYLGNQPTYNLSATWSDPNFMNTGNIATVQGFARNSNSMNVDYAMQRTFGTTVNFARQITPHVAASIGATADNTSLMDVGTINGNSAMSFLTNRALAMGAPDNQTATMVAQNIRNQQLKGGAYLSVSPQIMYDTRDRAVDPTSGTTVRLTSTPSLGLTNSSFLRAGASVSKFVKVGEEKTLAFNVQAGTNVFGNMPQFSQYRLGGWYGVRGYQSFSALGTGTSMLMATAEYRFPLPFVPRRTAIGKHVKGFFFFDTGGVSGNSMINNYYLRSPIAASVGVGLRFNIPKVGLIQVAYGFPLIASIQGKMRPQFSLNFGERF